MEGPRGPPDLQRHQLPRAGLAQRQATGRGQRRLHPGRVRRHPGAGGQRPQRSGRASLAAAALLARARGIREGGRGRQRRGRLVRRPHLLLQRGLGLDSHDPRPQHRHLAGCGAARHRTRERERPAGRHHAAAASRYFGGERHRASRGAQPDRHPAAGHAGGHAGRGEVHAARRARSGGNQDRDRRPENGSRRWRSRIPGSGGPTATASRRSRT